MGRLTSAQGPLLGRGPGGVGLGPGGHLWPREILFCARTNTHTHHSFQTLPLLHSLSVNKDLLNSFISFCV